MDSETEETQGKVGEEERAPQQEEPVEDDTAQPCACCIELTQDGVLCDSCDDWWCVSCIDQEVPGTLPLTLYAELAKRESFPWQCSKCRPSTLLPLQLKESKTMGLRQLLKLGVNKEALKERKKPEAVSSGETNIATVMKMMADQQMADRREARDAQERTDARAREDRKEAREAQDRMATQMLEAQRDMIEVVRETSRSSPLHSTTLYGPSPSLQAKLPKLELRKFGGDPMKWPDFWDSFKVNVHDQENLADTCKFEYLLQSLQGAPFHKIKGLGVQGDKYEDALAILEKCYGSEVVRRERSLGMLTHLPPVRDNWSNLEVYSNQLLCAVTSLRRIHMSEEAIDPQVTLLFERLPPTLRLEITKMRAGANENSKQWTMVKYMEYLDKVQDIYRTIKDPRGQEEGTGQQRTKQVSNPAFPQVGTTQDRPKRIRYPCPYCNSDKHPSGKCDKVKTNADRRQFIQRNNLCYGCLQTGHGVRECPRKRCFICKEEGHHGSICHKREEDKKGGEHQEAPAPSFFAVAGKRENIVMATVRATIEDPRSGKKTRLNVYLDTGAKFSAVRERSVKQLGLRAPRNIELKTSRFNATEHDIMRVGAVEFDFVTRDGGRMRVHAYTMRDLAPPILMQPAELDPQQRKVIEPYEPVNLPPPEEHEFAIDMILGLDHWFKVMGPKAAKQIPVSDELYIYTTPLGNILTGIVTKGGPGRAQLGPMMLCGTAADPVQRLWDLELLGINKAEGNHMDQVLEKRFQDTVEFKDGRYQVCFPFVDEEPKVCSNFAMAKGRLEKTVKSLVQEGQLAEYDRIIQDQVQKQVVELVTWKTREGELVHYLAHFPHIKRDSETTKVRIVYDASASGKGKKSLNDVMYQGVNYLKDIVGMLMRFRCHKIAMVSDIEKAFLQVALHPRHRDVTRFLWLKDPKKPTVSGNIQIHRFTRVPFGINASPYLLGATIRHHLLRNPGKVSAEISNNTYVDNVIVGGNSTRECIGIYKEGKELFRTAGMNLREWISNDPTFNTHIPEADRAKGPVTKVMGMVWDTDKDTIGVRFKEESEGEITKRSILHQVARCFDPMGLFSPILVKGRIELQTLWKEGKDWDDSTSEGTRTQWKEILKNVRRCPTKKLARQVMTKGVPTDILCFVDASPMAYAAAVYVRQEVDGKVETNLMYAKSRVAPLKPNHTIPRLELLATLIGVRAVKFVTKELAVEPRKTILWSDSQIVLSWIRSDSKLDVFVSNRVTEIKEKTANVHIRYINTKENLADLGTRGVGYDQLEASIWFKGPPWLNDPEEDWPTWNWEPGPRDTTVPSMVAHGDVRRTELPSPYGIECTDHSTLRKVLGATVYCQRFIDGVRKKTRPLQRAPTAEELRWARRKWLIWVQQTAYADLIQRLQKGKLDPLSRQLDLFVDKGGILRCGGRLCKAKIKFNAKFPALLPPAQKYTEMVIKECHVKTGHFGPRTTLAQLRKNYWIPHGLSVVGRITRQCLVCRKVEGGPFKPPRMPALPAERVTKAPAFKYTGLDYLGPLSVKKPGKGQAYEKRWVALFTCCSTRAIHLEVVPDCTAQAAINSVRRFVARRGTPDTILTDNALQFGKAARVLRGIWGKKVGEEILEGLTVTFSTKEIKWKNIPEGSPWVGGFYERLVGLVKRVIKKTLWRTTATDDQLVTLVANIEGIINTRPLLAGTGESPEDYKMLTPADMVAPDGHLDFPPRDDTEEEDPDYSPSAEAGKDYKEMYAKGVRKLNQFWKVWNTHYLQELRATQQCHHKAKRGEIPRRPRLGEVVLVKETTPRSSWKMGKVERLYEGEDGEIRFVRLKLPSGHHTKRGIKDLVPLELEIGGI
jgi:hypothetical protein